MATVIIQKRETKTGNRYDVKYADPFTGRKKHYKTYRRYKEANAMANDLRSTLDLGKVPKREKLHPMTFGDVSRSLKKEWASRLISNQISPKTHEDYVIWLNVLNRTFGNKLLCQIPKNEIVQFRDNLAGTLSNVSSNKYLSIIKKVFRHGLVLGAVVVDPSKNLPALSEKMLTINSDRVFCRIDGTPLKRFDSAWRAALKMAGITNFHFHDLRHTFCSNLILSGSNLKDAKEMIGHSDISMTDRYAHLTSFHKLSRQQQLAEHYTTTQ